MPKFIIQPYDKVRVGDLLIDGLQSNKWKEFHAVVAFVKRSGMKHIIKPLSKFSRRGRILICVGIDQDGTTIEGLQMLLDAAGKNSELYIFHNRNNSTFHPKIYIFRNKKTARVIIGSNNLTEGGIFTNYEMAVVFELKFSNKSDRQFIKKIDETIAGWIDVESGLSITLSSENLQNLINRKAILSEKQTRKKLRRDTDFERHNLNDVFGLKPIPKAPKVKIDNKYIETDEKDVNNELQVEDIPKSVKLKEKDSNNNSQKVVLIKYVPKAGKRTSQVHFTLDNMKNYFHLKASQHIRIIQKQPNETAKEVETRQLVLSTVNKNAKIEVGGARVLVKNYPTGEQKPILVFRKLEKDYYEYMLVIPNDEGYLPLSQYLNALPKSKALASDTISLRRMKQIWKDYPVD